MRILLWVVAFGLGAVVVRMIAKWTGFVGGNTLVDLLIDHSFGNYFRLFVLVPFWALFSTLFLTLFLEGPDWISRRHAGESLGPTAARTAKLAAASAAAGVAAPAASTPAGAAVAMPAGAAAGAGTTGAAARTGAGGTIPRRVPAAVVTGGSIGGPTRPRTIRRRGDEPGPEPEPQSVATAPRQRPGDRTQALTAVPVAAEEPEPRDEYAERAAAGHRPRRIPRRDVGS